MKRVDAEVRENMYFETKKCRGQTARIIFANDPFKLLGARTSGRTRIGVVVPSGIFG